MAELADAQHGRVAAWQLINGGLTRAWIRGRVGAGWLRAVRPGVYAVGHASRGSRATWMEATLAGGPEALLFHPSASALWGLGRDSTTVTHVLVPGGRGRSRDGIVFHDGAPLPPEDKDRVDGIPVTSLGRTLLDAAVTEPIARVRTLVEEAERLRIFDLCDVEAVLVRHAGRRGVSALRAAIDVAAETGLPPFTRSEFERRLHELCRDDRLAIPSMNVWIAEFEVDACWPEQRLILECDSWEHHRTRAAFERDRERDARLMILGYRVIRITWRRLVREPQRVAEELRRLLLS